MVYMLKKISVAAILIVVLMAFTVGSVSPGSTAYKTSYSGGEAGRIMYMNPGDLYSSPMPFMGMPSLAFLQLLAANNVMPEQAAGQGPNPFTSVTLDLSGQGLPGINDSWPAADGPAIAGMPRVPGFGGRDDFIVARMIVQMAGNSTPQEFPVQFFRHGPDDIKNRTVNENFIANMYFRMSHDASGNPTGLTMYTGNDTVNDSDSVFTFNGEITVAQPLSNDSSQAGSPYTNTITSGQTVYHEATISGASTSLNVSLKWADPSDSMRLTIYTPDGHVLGPYYDNSDGKIDNAINLEIDNPSGVADGTWIFKVVDTGTTGKDEYYIKTW